MTLLLRSKGLKGISSGHQCHYRPRPLQHSRPCLHAEVSRAAGPCAGRQRQTTSATIKEVSALPCQSRMGSARGSMGQDMRRRSMVPSASNRPVSSSSPAPSSSSASPPPPRSDELDGKRILIIGGTGRVGSSTAAALKATFPGSIVTLASRDRASYDQAVQRRPELAATSFKRVDIQDASSIKEALAAGVDLVVHAAGPFQGSENHQVLEAAIQARVPYLDISDDMAYSERSISRFGQAAQSAGIPAIVSSGIFPGTSNVMAAHIISIGRKEYTQDWEYKANQQGGASGATSSMEGDLMEPTLLRYSYYTAGSGGAGTTILETSLLLAGEEAIVYKEGKEYRLPPISNRREVDFGPGIGNKGLYVYNLPEVASAYKHLGVKGVSARFGTDPFYWNWAMWLTARLIPRSLLRNKSFVKGMTKLIEPFVRFTDKTTGEAVAMRVEVSFEGDKAAAGIFVHRRMSDAVGYSVAAFARAMLLGQTQPGVWYPEQREALSDRRALLRLAATGCERFDLNKPLWSLESELSSFAGMIYW